MYVKTNESKNTYCIKLYLEFDRVDCYSPFFAPRPKNRSRAYVTGDRAMLAQSIQYVFFEKKRYNHAVYEGVQANYCSYGCLEVFSYVSVMIMGRVA